METLFENKCIFSKGNLLEMAKKSRSKSKDIIIYILFVFCMGLVILSSVQYKYLEAGIYLIFCLIIVCLYLFLPYMNVNKAMKQFKEIYHTEVETTVLFFDDYMVSINKQTAGEIKMDYLQIIKVKQTKGLYLLQMQQNINILVDKNGFTKGDREGFITFIKEKAGNAKIRI